MSKDQKDNLYVEVKDHLFAEAQIFDSAEYQLKKKTIDLSIHDLARHDELLKSLSNSFMRSHNLQNVWEKNIQTLVNSLDSLSGMQSEMDEPLNIAENASNSGIAITTLRVAHKEKGKALTDVSIHIVSNNRLNKTLIVGEEIPSKLRQAFIKANILYVNRNAADARRKTEIALSETLGMVVAPYRMSPPGTDAVGDRLLLAFRYRNDVELEEGALLSETLVNGKIEPLFPKYVVKMK